MSLSSLSPDSEKGTPRAGYPSLAAWIAHDPDNESFVFRKFDRLSARSLLTLQSQLVALEAKLDRLDNAMRNSREPDVLVSLAHWETYEERARVSTNPEYEKMKLEVKLKEKLKEYHEALLLQSEICKLGQPSSRVLKIYRTFFKLPSPILCGNASQMLDNAKDLAALRPPLETDPLSRLLRDHWPFRGNPYSGELYSDPRDTTHYILESHVKWVVILITTVVAAIFLIGAIAGLYFVKRPGAKLGIIAGLTTLFAASVGGLTSAKRQEVLAASATYAALLVVFVSGDFDKGNPG